MTKVAVRFIVDYHDYKKDDVIYVLPAIALKLINEKQAVYENMPVYKASLKVNKVL